MTDFLNALTYNPNHPLLFNSVLFFLLFSFLYGIYVLVINKVKTRNIILLIFSLYFYYKISGIAVIILFCIATSDYFIGKGIFKIKKKPGKTILLFLSIIINLGSLFYFKYTNFFLKLWDSMQGGNDPLVYNIIMPIGISFFVFKSLSYIFDIYRGDIEQPEKKYFNYVLYVAFFPNILAGPISRASDLLPQFKEKISLSETNIGMGFFLIMCGAFKKIFIADFLAGNFVDRVFDAPDYFSGFESLMAGYGYMIQLYFDFSGYTDIVIGIACLLGFSIMPNFNKPFSSVNVTDFWRRWHMTLSSWLRDYLFTPLTLGLRNWKTFGIILSLIITFVLCGFWHGANLTFIIWGGLHALAMVWDVITNKSRSKIRKKTNKNIYKFISIFITFHFLCFSFIIFRAADVATAMKIYSKIFTSLDFSLFTQWVNLYLYPFLILIFGLVLHYTPMKWNVSLQNSFTKLHWILKAAVVVFAFILIYQVFSSQSQPFIYLEF
ncbi:MAG TPA: MBOAT family O-acyltransferase [Bacteroidales bacterium]|mgnify:CR=1 FL=1|nr:MBOAT family O-acyltransferase [Bacteroidales bacterium]HPS15725.1 MBOAT family O-acyltransferase [Bacteroidales bacterium]